MSGADGEKTPSASGSPDSQAPQEPEEAQESAGEGGAEQRRPRLLPVWILLGAAVASGGAWAVTERLGAGRRRRRRRRCVLSPRRRNPGRSVPTIRAVWRSPIRAR